MKTVTVNGQNVVVFRERGRGDDWGVVRYMIEESDGTYSMVGEGYSDPAVADKVYASPDDAHLQWIIDEARRQTQKPEERASASPAERPTPLALTADDKTSISDADDMADAVEAAKKGVP